jgi:ribonuclease-3
MANCYEAVLGAIYLDSGYESTKVFIQKTLLNTFDQILKEGSWMDPKSYLQEIAQSNEGLTPTYRVLDEIGPDHDKAFTVGVFIKGKLKGQGNGPSKQIAQVAAAKAALEQYKLVK